MGALGLMGGAMALCCLNVGFFLLGAGAGTGVGYALYAGLLHNWPIYTIGNETSAMMIGCLSLGALLGGLTTLHFKKSIMIVVTSLCGAAGSTVSLTLILSHVDVHFLAVFKSRIDSQNVAVYVQAGSVLLLFLLGLFVQCRHGKKAHKKYNETAMSNRTPMLISP